MNRDLLSLYRNATGRHKELVLNTIARECRPLVTQKARRFCRNRCRVEDREDVLQTAWLGFRKALDGWDPDKASWGTYLHYWVTCYLQRMLRNGKGTLVRHATTVKMEEEQFDWALPETDEDDEDPARKVDLARLVSQLPPKEQRVVREHLAGKNFQEIAEGMGILRGSVKYVFDKAIAQMRRAA